MGGDQSGGLCGPQKTCKGSQSLAGLSYTPPNSQVCSGPRPLGRSGAEKAVVLSGGRGDGREDRCGSGRFQTSISCTAVFLTKPSSSAACEPEQAELVVGPGCSADIWGVLSSEEGSVSWVKDSCTCRRHPLRRDKTEQSPGGPAMQVVHSQGRAARLLAGPS